MSEQEKKEITAEEKAKAAAAAKAKAAAAAKAKAAAAAKAKAAAAAKAKAAVAKAKAQGGETTAGVTDEEKAKAIAAAKAKAAAAAKARRAQAGGEEEETEPKKPSVNQPYLDKYVRVITDNIGADVIEEAYINELGKEVPTLVINNENWFQVAQFLKNNEQLAFDYLSTLHGTDFETHLETYYHFYSYKEKQSIAIRVKIERDNPLIASVTPIWAGADWPERESYDLVGIIYEGHPNLTRILLPDDWVGHPLRKDYEQHDEEV